MDRLRFSISYLRWPIQEVTTFGFYQQNVDLGHTQAIRQRETLSHQGAITQEVCCCKAQYLIKETIFSERTRTW